MARTFTLTVEDADVQRVYDAFLAQPVIGVTREDPAGSVGLVLSDFMRRTVKEYEHRRDIRNLPAPADLPIVYPTFPGAG